jgi:hypothetical protein
MLKWVCFKVWIVHELDCKTSIFLNMKTLTAATTWSTNWKLIVTFSVYTNTCKPSLPSWRVDPIPCHDLPCGASLSHPLDTSHSVGLLWARDRPDAETCTWNQTTITRDKQPCPRAGFKPTILQRERPQTRLLDREATGIGCSCILGNLFRTPIVSGFPSEWKTQSRIHIKQRVIIQLLGVLTLDIHK